MSENQNDVPVDELQGHSNLIDKFLAIINNEPEISDTSRRDLTHSVTQAVINSYDRSEAHGWRRFVPLWKFGGDKKGTLISELWHTAVLTEINIQQDAPNVDEFDVMDDIDYVNRVVIDNLPTSNRVEDFACEAAQVAAYLVNLDEDEYMEHREALFSPSVDPDELRQLREELGLEVTHNNRTLPHPLNP